MSNIRKNQINRILNKNKRKRRARVKVIAIGLCASLSLTIAYFSLFRKDNAKADTAQLLVSTENQQNAEKNIQKIQDKKAYSDKLLAYKKVNTDSQAFETIANDAKPAFKVRRGDYIEYFGEENAWAKVSKNNQIAYIPADKLADVPENQLVVKSGVLMDGKKYKFPEDFETVFDVNTENSMMVMFEAMKRENLEIGVSRKTVENKELYNEENQEYSIPDYSNHTLRTGSSIEVEIPGVTENINFEETPQGKWLKENAHKYGFVLRYPKGKESVTGFYSNDRVFRYLGVELATHLYENNLTIDEYFK